MSQCATWFVEITCQNDQQAVLLASKWQEIDEWCGLLASHGPVHCRHNRLIVMAYGGKLDVRKVPLQVVKIEEFFLLEKFDSNYFVWPDQPHNPTLLRHKIIFKPAAYTTANGGRPQSAAVSPF